MRLIDADALLAKQEFVAGGVYVDAWYVELAPTVEAEPVKHGRWALDSSDLCHCTVCNCYRNIKTQVWWDNCPNCGAKMDLEES